MNDWLPIETLPSDGRRVLLRDEAFNCSDVPLPLIFTPTHWMDAPDHDARVYRMRSVEELLGR